MKVTVQHQDKDSISKHKEICDSFLRFLYSEYPLKHDLKVYFLSNRVGEMTTGARTDEHVIKVLSKGRMNRDILRTVAHEWVHEYQRDVMKRDRGQDIGGKNENEANSIAGILIKKFEKKFPNFEKLMYEQFVSRY
jgi:hypothetical protein